MRDPETRFLRMLGLKAGRLDFWNIPNELNRYELMIHAQCEAIEPTGEDRADLRAAWMTAHLIAAQSAKPLSDADAANLLKSLREYLDINKTEDDATSSEVLAMIGV